MNLRKRQRNPTTDDVVLNRTKKLQRISSSSSITSDKNRQSILCFEDLANEIIHEIFDYLEAYQIYQSFFNLNTRFQNLLLHVNVPITADISTHSKSTFERYRTDFIRPMQRRMRILRVSDPITIEYIFPMTEDTSFYSQLQTLSLENIEPKYLEDLLHRLAVLPSLSSLTMHVRSDVNKTKVYTRLFQFPVLKFCQLSFEQMNFVPLLPACTNPSSLIERLIIDDSYLLNQIDALISYLPHLRHLIIPNKHSSVLIALLFNDLTQLIFPIRRLESDDIDQFLKQRAHDIKLLHLCLMHPESYPHIKLPTESILSYLPCMKVVHSNSAKEMVCGPTFDVYESCFSYRYGFFQDIRQWFFTHEPMSDENLHQLFCSFAFPRRRFAAIRPASVSDNPVCYGKSANRSVRSVAIKDMENVDHCTESFPNAMELTLNLYHHFYRQLYATESLRRVIPLTQIKKLTIQSQSFTLKEMLDTLLHIPNVHALTVSSLYSAVHEVSLLEESENFRLVLERNKIQSIHITRYLSRTIKTLIKLCPGLQHLSINTHRQPFQAVMRFLLAEHRNTACHVSSLSLSAYRLDEVLMGKVKTIVESKKNEGEYSLKANQSEIYLAW